MVEHLRGGGGRREEGRRRLEEEGAARGPVSADQPFCLQWCGVVRLREPPPLRPPGPAKKFQCDFCGKSFQWQSNLQLHVRSHTGEKPYPCARCSYRATQRSDLTKHMRIHTGEKPYACPHCHYRAAYTSSLKDHILLHHRSAEPPPALPH